MLQGVESARHDAADQRAQLIASARDAAMPTENVLASARQIALTLSNVPDIRAPDAGCNSDLAGALRSLPSFSSISRADADGRILCAALPRAIGRSISDRAFWAVIRRSHGFVVSGLKQSRVLNQPVVIGFLPLHDDSGHFIGTISVAIEARWLHTLLARSHLPGNSVVAIFDSAHHIIAASDAALANTVFAAARAGSAQRVETATDAQNRRWSYATAALLDNSIYVGFARRDDALFGASEMSLAFDFFLPILMILLTWLAIWTVTERQLTRWILYLSRVAAAYSAGHYAVRPQLADAPSEMRLLGDSLARMAASVEERDRSLREAVEQKTLLIREIHHRVKNNLQIVMSLLNLQAGQLRDSAAQEALRQTQARVNALALVHRILYEIDDQSLVDVKPLLEELAQQTREGFGGARRGIRVLVDSVAREMSSEAAVPLALLTVEALTNAFKHAFAPGQGGTISVTLAPGGEGRLRLTIADDGTGFACETMKPGIGARLIRTFGSQVGGSAEFQSGAGAGTRVEIVFPDPAA